MDYVIKRTDSEGVVEFFDGAAFVPELVQAQTSSSLDEARYLQGVYQSQFPDCDVVWVKVSKTLTVS